MIDYTDADSDLFSVMYRDGTPTPADYREAAQELLDAADQIENRNWIIGCAICADSGHDARQCHHNTLIAARSWAATTDVYVCWHCGFTATNEEEGREHFGINECDAPACLSVAQDPKVP